MRGGLPAGQGRARLGRGRLAEEKAHDAAVAGAKGKTATRGQVEPAGMAANLGKHGGEPAAGKALLDDPERLARPVDTDDHHPARRQAEAIQSRPIGQARFASDRRFHHPEDRAVVRCGEPGENGEAEAGRSTCGPRRLAADLMKSIPAEAAGEEPVEFWHAEGKHRAAAARGKRRGPGIGQEKCLGRARRTFLAMRPWRCLRSLSVTRAIRFDLKPKRPAFDLGDLPAQSGKPVACHKNARAHGL
jgi:hypothetical protein